jgi:hypothetical protein
VGAGEGLVVVEGAKEGNGDGTVEGKGLGTTVGISDGAPRAVVGLSVGTAVGIVGAGVGEKGTNWAEPTVATTATVPWHLPSVLKQRC